MIETKEFDRFEKDVATLARQFEYPRTPDLAVAFRRSTSLSRSKPMSRALAIALLLVAIAALLAVPEVRARLLEFLHIGGIRIEVPAQKESNPTAIANNLIDQFGQLIRTSNLSGETTLEEARDSVDFDIPLPTYPSSLGAPDHVFVQSVDPGKSLVVLTWMDKADPEKVDIALYVIDPGISITKGPVDELLATTVNGQPAAYIRGTHFLEVDRLPDYGVLVQAPALIWETDGVTYRIEADLPLSELVRIAVSLDATQ